MPRSLAFLAGGGEMGALIRAYPWHDTPLGPPETWSPALRVVVRLLLNTRQPSYIFWGKEAICLYNDAYRAWLGSEFHPSSLGRPAREVWSEIWPLIGPQISQVMNGGGGTFHENQSVRLVNGGAPQESFWTYSYSPIDDEAVGGIGGVFVICTETTEQVLHAWRLMRESEQRHSLFQRLPAFVAILRGPNHVYEYANDSYMAFTGPRDLIGHSVREMFPELAGQGFYEMLDDVFRTGKAVALHSTPVRLNDEDSDRFIDLRYDPIYDETGAICGIFVSGYDLTERVQAERRRETLAELSERLRNLSDPAEISAAAAQLLGVTMRVSRAGYGTIDATAETLRVEQGWNAPETLPLSGVVRLRDYGSFIDDLKRGFEIAVSDVETDERTAASAANFIAQNVRAFANVPVIEQGALVAVLYLDHAEPRPWPEADLAFIREFAERTRTAVERGRSEMALRALTASLEDQVEARTRERDRLWESSEDLLAIAGYDGELIRISPSWTRRLGHDAQTLLSRSYMDFIHPDDAVHVVADMARMRESGQPIRFRNRFRATDGSWRWISWSLVPERGAARVHAVGRDITTEIEANEKHRALEEQLRQSQKMEAVGQLTGGIAHDFNNMIQGITGSLQIATRRLAQGRTDEIGVFVGRAVTAAERAASLTHRLLAFSRRQPLDPRLVDANVLVGSLAELFRRTIGERISFEFLPAAGLWSTLCDPNQLESSLLNLVLNARDAMPNGGTLKIETRNANLAAADVTEHGDLAPGDYVCISVTDTGTGMSADTMGKAFEPFFTTKSIGQGTGLGLSMVYGFARQSEGFARIHSTPGVGTSVDICLPRHDRAADAEPPQTEPVTERLVGRGETVLVIEDDAVVRSVVVEILTEAGYHVLQAPDGHSGLALLQSDIAIDLLLTDIGLPGLDGQHIAKAGRERRRELKILFMTGYAESAAAAAGFLDHGMQLITKPFDVEGLPARINAMLEG